MYCTIEATKLTTDRHEASCSLFCDSGTTCLYINYVCIALVLLYICSWLYR